MTPTRGWTQHYYDAVEFYYWEPDKIECQRVANPARVGATAVLERLQRLEEPLNHILAIFFDLAPAYIVRDFLSSMVGFDVGEDICLSDRSIHNTFPGLNVVQPDLLFEGAGAVVSIEVKVDAKSSLQQVLKYALLHEALAGSGRASALVYLTRRPFSACWPPGTADQGVIEAAIDYLATISGLGQLPIDAELRQRIELHLRQMRLVGITFSDLHRATMSWRAEADGVWARLCDGLCLELEARSMS